MTSRNQTCSHESLNKPRKFRIGGLLTTGLLVSLIILGINSLLKSELPETAELFTADVVPVSPTRLELARKAAQRGDCELAVHEYLESIQEDVSTADLALREMVELFLSVAREHGTGERYVDQSAQINRCYQLLIQLKQADSATKALPEPARNKLFEEIARVLAEGRKAAKLHIDLADKLRKEAKGYFNDDEDKQADALHRVNLAWSYYPNFTDDELVKRMYAIWADMKSELAAWQYNQVMEQDRLRLGRIFGDR